MQSKSEETNLNKNFSPESVRSTGKRNVKRTSMMIWKCSVICK